MEGDRGYFEGRTDAGPLTQVDDASFANSPVLADSRTAREGGFAGAVRRDASRCCASGFFADELPSWPGSGFPKRVSASVAVFFFACVDKDR